jgi:hypothetical protein
MSQQTSRQHWEQDVLAADRDFFTALVGGDEQALDSVLADDFVLVGVNDGMVVPRAVLMPLVGQGQLQFDAIEPDRSEVLVRRYGMTAIVVGRTEMRGSYAGAPFSARSREVVPGFVGFEVGSSSERLTWDAPRTAKSEEEDPGCKTPTRPPRTTRRWLLIVTGCGWSVRPRSGWMSGLLAVWTGTWLGSPSTCARGCWPPRSRSAWRSWAS